jgi:hypothetical protein
MPTIIGQIFGNAGNGIYMFESTWHMLLHVTIRWQFVHRRHTRDKQATHLLHHLHSVIAPRREYNTNYSCRVLTTFKVVHEAVYGLLATIRKVAHTSSTTWRANLCHLMPNIPEQDHQCNDLGTHKSCALLCVHCHLMVTFTSASQPFSNIYTPCPTLPYFGTKTKKVAMTYGVTHVFLHKIICHWFALQSKAIPLQAWTGL